MFINKKNILPSKPKPPDIDQILQDIKNSANKDDVTYKLLAHESAYTDNSISAESNNINYIYKKIKIYLDMNKKLKIFKESIDENEEFLESSVKNMMELTEEIKEQAQAAVIY